MSHRVLLIEDSTTQAHLFTSLLQSSGFQVEQADCLAAGLRRLSAGGINAVLLDLTLPDSDGLQTFLRVNGQVQALNIPVVILTGTDDVKLGARAVEAGAQDYLVKGGITAAALSRAVHYA